MSIIEGNAISFITFCTVGGINLNFNLLMLLRVVGGFDITGRQLKMFNSQSLIEVGAVRHASSRRLLRTFQGTIVG